MRVSVGMTLWTAAGTLSPIAGEKMFSAWAQDISAGPVTVDTGNNWLDFGFVIALLVLVTVLGIIYKRWTK